jgi:hypothetical protein
MPAIAGIGMCIASGKGGVLPTRSGIAIKVVSSGEGAAGGCPADDWSMASAVDSLSPPSKAAMTGSPPSLFSSNVPITRDISLPHVDRCPAIEIAGRFAERLLAVAILESRPGKPDGALESVDAVFGPASI